jgi:hypothetical protein
MTWNFKIWYENWAKIKYEQAQAGVETWKLLDRTSKSNETVLLNFLISFMLLYFKRELGIWSNAVKISTKIGYVIVIFPFILYSTIELEY